MIVVCTHCGTTLDDGPCVVCESESPSGMARFAALFVSGLNRGASLDEAAREAAPIARTEIEA